MSRQRAKSYPQQAAIARQVVVDGLTPAQAGERHGIHRRTVTRYLHERGYRPEKMGAGPRWVRANNQESNA